MDIKKLAPWNWFKKEEEQSHADLPIKRDDRLTQYVTDNSNPLIRLHREMDRLFDSTFRGFGQLPATTEFSIPFTTAGLLKPRVDIGATTKEYSITVEVPGINEKDVKVEISGNTMTIRGEKKQEKEEKEKDYYKIERSYGAFQRILSLPEDADQDNIKASFKNGVLTIKMPRKALPDSHVKQIEIM